MRCRGSSCNSAERSKDHLEQAVKKSLRDDDDIRVLKRAHLHDYIWDAEVIKKALFGLVLHAASAESHVAVIRG